MHKAEQSLRRLVPFRSQISSIINHLLHSDTPFTSPLTEGREVKQGCVIVFGSDDGLCGAYNVNIFKQLVAEVKEYRAKNPGAGLTIVPVGKKITALANKLAGDKVIVEALSDVNSKTEGAPVDAFMKGFEEAYLSGKYDAVKVLYTHFYSAGRQRIETSHLLPVDNEAFSQDFSMKKPADAKVEEPKADTNTAKPYLFEPDAETIFRTVLPMFLMSTMQEYFCQNRASEQAARVMAMQSANDNAKKLLEQLRLEYNKLRQQSITTELLDIVGGQVRD